MSYSKQTWTTGDTVTAAMLNHMEDGIEEAAQGDVVLTGTYANGVISITTDPLPSEDVIKNAYESGRGVVVRIGNDAAYEIYRAIPFSTSNLNSTNAYTFAGIGEDFDGYRKRFYIDFFYSDSDPVVSAHLIQDGRYIVTLTPTALDYSGTMDKTPEEITAAYEAGQEIVFNVVGFPGFDHVYIPAAWCTYATGQPNCSACATLVDVNNDIQIIIFTSVADGGTAYYTDIYSLTPAS